MTARQRRSASRPGQDAADVTRQDQLWQDFRRTRSRLARNRLVVAFAPLVRAVASRLRLGLPSSVDIADLESDGYIGLMGAVEKFEPQRGRSDFPAYAVPRIRGAIVDGLRATDWVPRTVRRKIRAISAATADLERRHGRAPSDDEIAAELRISRARLRVIRAQTSYSRLVSLVSLEAAGLGDLPQRQVGEVEDGRSGVVRDAVRQLPEREQLVIAMSYWGRLTLNEIGLVLGLSESRVSQLRSQANRALRISLSRRLDK